MAEEKKGALFTGTSNVVMPGTKQSFPPEYHNKTRLNYYASLLNSVEINSTFKKIPLPSTFQKWALDVPTDFRFTIKIWKEITHVKKLEIDLSKIELFCNAANHIGNNKGCLLLQFPGSITLEYFGIVEQILERLSQANENHGWSIAVEFRSITWYCGESMELLDEHNASMVLHDKAKSQNAMLNRHARFIYYRFHGPTGDYRGDYTEASLLDYAQKIKGYLNSGKDVYAYFNNTLGNAFENAITLREMVNK